MTYLRQNASRVLVGTLLILGVGIAVYAFIKRRRRMHDTDDPSASNGLPDVASE